MPIVLTCGCGKKLSAPDDYAGRTATCKACGATVAIPAGASLDPPASVPPPTLPGRERQDDAREVDLGDDVRRRRFFAGLTTAWIVVAVLSALSAGFCLAFAGLSSRGDDGARLMFGWIGSAVNAGVFSLIAATVAAFCRRNA